MTLDLNSAARILERSFAKASRGEGSRGGKVVGHSKSGRAIYESSVTKHPRDWTVDDAHAVVREHIQRKHLPGSLKVASDKAHELSAIARASGKASDKQKAQAAHAFASNQYRGVRITAPKNTQISSAAQHLERHHSSYANLHKWAAKPAEEVVAAEHRAWSSKYENEGSFLDAKAGRSAKKSQATLMDMLKASASKNQSSTIRPLTPMQECTMTQEMSKAVAPRHMKALGTTDSGKTIHGLGHSMNAPIANGILAAGKKVDRASAAKNIHTFHPTYSKADHLDASIAHYKAASASRALAVQHSAKGTGLHSEHLADAERHGALGLAHHAASLATGRGTGAARKMSAATMAKSEAEIVLGKFLSKAGSKGEGSRGGKVIAHTKSGKPIYAPGHVRHELMNSNNLDKQGHYLAMTHRKYTAQDHADASDHYEKLRDADDHGPERLKLHKIALSHHSARLIKESGEYDAIRNTGKKGSKPATASHWAAANHFNKKFSTDAARHEIDRTSKSMFKASGEGSRGGKTMSHIHIAKQHTVLAQRASEMGRTRSAHLHSALSANHLAQHHEASGNAAAAATAWKQSAFHQERARASGAPRIKKAEGNGLDNNLFKGSGEGSRGGKVIAHTKSGKPIYAPNHVGELPNGKKIYEPTVEQFGEDEGIEHAYAKAHPHFTAEDHAAAAEFYQKKASNNRKGKYVRHLREHAAHLADVHDTLSSAGRGPGHRYDSDLKKALSSLSDLAVAHSKAAAEGHGRGMTKSEGNGLDVNDLTPSLLEAHSPEEFNTQAAAISGACMWGPTVVAGAGNA